MTTPSELRTFSATCHCTSSTLTFTLPTSSLPIPVHFCHCTICFKTHGTLISTHAPIPPPTTNFATLTSYQSSEFVTKWFCTTCGAHMLDNVDEEGGRERWLVTASMVKIEKEEEKEVWEYMRHIFVGDTKDGGVAELLECIGGDRLTLWKERQTDGERFGEHRERALSHQEIDSHVRGGHEKLRVACHCGGVVFSIDRRDTAKWPGRHCACNSCRLTSSSFVTSWISVDVSAIAVNDHSMDPGDGKLLGLGTEYQSSKGRTRTFCSVCGSSVSYMRKDEPGILQVAAGLVDSRGAMALDWVDWDTKVDGKGDAQMMAVVQALQDGLNNALNH